MAKRAGLEPHLTVMVGYPWETKEDIMETIALVKHLFNSGYCDTLQATIVIPYPGTPLFQYCQENGLLTAQDWDDYDMRQPVIKTGLTNEEIKRASQELYKVFFTPKYVFRRLTSIRSLSDLKYIGRGLKAIYGHLRDFTTSLVPVLFRLVVFREILIWPGTFK